jgi:hypothetical protein
VDQPVPSPRTLLLAESDIVLHCHSSVSDNAMASATSASMRPLDLALSNCACRVAILRNADAVAPDDQLNSHIRETFSDNREFSNGVGGRVERAAKPAEPQILG